MLFSAQPQQFDPEQRRFFQIERGARLFTANSRHLCFALRGNKRAKVYFFELKTSSRVHLRSWASLDAAKAGAKALMPSYQRLDGMSQRIDIEPPTNPDREGNIVKW